MTTNKTLTIAIVLAAYAMAVSCVDHRPLRTEVFNENVYMDKDFLTQENPNRKGTSDHAWLYKVTVIKSSAPDIGLLFPGENSSPRYVRFQFNHSKMEMTYDLEWAPKVKDADGKVGPSPSLSPAVLNAWSGEHVDIKMKDNMDGERTNVIEENKEAPWKERQYFKVDFEKAAVNDVNMLYWANTDYSIGDCATLRSVSLVPNSFSMEKDATKTGSEKGDDYFTWTVALTYEARVFGGGYYCGNILTNAMDRNTFTYHVKYSFWRPPDSSDYAKNRAIELKEKEIVRRKLGAFETKYGRLNVFFDPKTDITGAKSYLLRFDPDKAHTFYFSPSFPEKYKKHFSEDVTKQYNDLMKSIGVKMRISFKDHDYDCTGSDKSKCKKRTYGDIRYSMVTYHNMPSTSGLIGMAYLDFDPRSGLLYSAGFNMYDWIDRLYANFIQDYMTSITTDTFGEEGKPDPIQKTACKVGDTVKINTTTLEKKFTGTSLYTKLSSYMNQKAEDWVPKRTEDFGKYMRMLLPEVTFAHPGANDYVSHGMAKHLSRVKEMRLKEQKFMELNNSIDKGTSPFGGHNPLTTKGIETALAQIKQSKDLVKNHFELRAHEQLLGAYRLADYMPAWEMPAAMVRSSRKCIKDTKTNKARWETRDEWGQRLVDNLFKFVATHEFGHSLSLRHNFYGSMDEPNFRGDDITSSIMEYAFTMAEGGGKAEFKKYDEMALKWIYGSTPKDKKKYLPSTRYLYCTDEHTYFSPMCTPHDMGVTPTEIIKNEIDYYEWRYKFRNFRKYRKFWNTWSYGNQIINAFYPMRRFLHLWGIDWYGSGIKNDLMLLGVKGDENFFNNVTDEFNDELGRAMRLTANFYKAILQQSAAERSYATKFDNFFGDVTQQGIILDKYYAMLLFIGLWDVDDYDQNIYAAMAFHEYSLGNSLFYSDCQDVADSMIGGQYDVYPWFKPLAVMVFAQDTHSVMFSDKAKQKWIEMVKFDRLQDLIDYFGSDPRKEALKKGNDYQVFKDSKGDDWIYYYMQDRQLHLAANKNRNPTAYKIMWDHNESINVNKSGSLDDTLKYYLEYYHYFN